MAIAQYAVILQLKVDGVAAGLLEECDDGRTLCAPGRFGGDVGYGDALEIFQLARRLGLTAYTAARPTLPADSRGRFRVPWGPKRAGRMRAGCRSTPWGLRREGGACAFHVDDGLDEVGALVGHQPRERPARRVDRDDRGADAIQQFGTTTSPQLMRHDVVLRRGILAGLKLIDPGIAHIASCPSSGDAGCWRRA